MSVIELWQRATASFVCSVDCSSCHEIYFTDKCPMRTNYTDHQVNEFIKRVNILLIMHDNADKDNMVLTDEEFIGILTAAADKPLY